MDSKDQLIFCLRAEHHNIKFSLSKPKVFCVFSGCTLFGKKEQFSYSTGTVMIPRQTICIVINQNDYPHGSSTNVD